jgi:hypothetical protein
MVQVTGWLPERVEVVEQDITVVQLVITVEVVGDLITLVGYRIRFQTQAQQKADL